MKLISGVLYHDSIAVPGTNVRVAGWIEMKRIGEATMKKKLILAALLMSMAVTVYAEEVVWEEQTATGVA